MVNANMKVVNVCESFLKGIVDPEMKLYRSTLFVQYAGFSFTVFTGLLLFFFSFSAVKKHMLKIFDRF